MIQESVDQNGVIGQLFFPEQPRYPKTLVVVLGGSSGGLRHASTAERLARDGVAACALAYFGVDGLPPKLDRIPLEYFFKAFSLLLDRDEFAEHHLICLGHSRGAELALQLATCSDVFAGVIVTSPSHVRWGATAANKPAWLQDGKPLPFVEPVPLPDLQLPTISHRGRDHASYREWYLAQMERSSTVKAAVIPVEKIDCPVMMFSGLDDQLWPSALFADVIEQELLTVSRSVENVQYENVGHVIPLPDESPRLFSWHDALGSGVAYGGDHDASMVAAKDRWERILAFLDKTEDTGGK
ncbi:MAG TPA: acyl-CoA thioester hydrolase/BAAT C-terminal domain-containing protein [Anaerolineales bacterium]|nr:acyl-CoA thioester hydrolase/BAAT C-terminal domain-containing protein [Anaerolineales bacterium]